jgi:hypothetical protein
MAVPRSARLIFPAAEVPRPKRRALQALQAGPVRKLLKKTDVTLSMGLYRPCPAIRCLSHLRGDHQQDPPEVWHCPEGMAGQCDGGLLHPRRRRCRNCRYWIRQEPGLPGDSCPQPECDCIGSLPDTGVDSRSGLSRAAIGIPVLIPLP